MLHLLLLRDMCLFLEVVDQGGVRKGSDIATQQSEARVPARAYVVRTREEGDANDVVTDPGSSHSYVNTKLVESRNLKSEMSRVSIVVSSPLGQSVLNIIFLVDLLIMPFGDFDIILGMDWLSEHGLILDCCKKKFIVQSENGNKTECSKIQTVCEFLDVFPDVFPEELSGLQPNREVEFVIEIYPGTASVSIP
ncbi:polyprotein [Gossypium australe]|uniref:Polyprotein n=1 Tax=Gossypium australe TaxID=47621 RepID=A0A5B6WQC8_9ROSI|nr:polyprotein [Gossypium australe]